MIKLWSPEPLLEPAARSFSFVSLSIYVCLCVCMSVSVLLCRIPADAEKLNHVNRSLSWSSSFRGVVCLSAWTCMPVTGWQTHADWQTDRQTDGRLRRTHGLTSPMSRQWICSSARVTSLGRCPTDTDRHNSTQRRTDREWRAQRASSRV